MSIQDRIAKRLLKDHRDQCERIAGSFFTNVEDHQQAETSEYRRAEVTFGPDGALKLSCLVADQQDMQIQGLQKHSELGMYEGMLFPYEEPRKVSFHMGEVKFPIDIIFVGSDGRVTKKVESIEPGSPGRWGMDHVSAVIEANGGFCASHNVEVGMPVLGLNKKIAQMRSGQVFVVWDNVNDPQASGHVCFKANSPQQAAKFFELHKSGQDMLSQHGGIVPDEWGDTSMPPTIIQTDQGTYGVDGPYNDPELSGDTGIDTWTVSDPSSGRNGPAMASKHAQQNNGFGTVDHGGQQYTVAEDMMEVDQGMMGGGIRYTVMFSPSQDVFWAEDSRAGHMIAGPCKSMQELGMQLGPNNRQAQEVYPRAPRKDLNPKMMPPINETPDRFRNRDLVDQQVMNQTAPAYSETEGYDPITYHDSDDVKPTRMAAPGPCPACGKDLQVGNHALCQQAVPLGQSDITRDQYQKWDPQTQVVNDINLGRGIEPMVMPDQNPSAPADLGAQVPYGTDKRGEWFELDKGYDFCVIDVTGVPEGGNMTYEVHLNVNRGGILVLDSPDGWGERCFWQEDGEDEPVDEISLNAIARDLGDDVEMMGFNLILRYFNLTGVPEDIIGRWTALEGVGAGDGILVDHNANTHPGEPGFKEISKNVKPTRSS